MTEQGYGIETSKVEVSLTTNIKVLNVSTGVIENGNIYIAQPPFYQIKKGKKVYYAYTDPEKTEILNKLGVKDDEVEEIDEELNLEPELRYEAN